MSEARRRHPEARRGQPRNQFPEPWTPGQETIDLREAVKSRRSLDAQGSAELIPTAGPDAAADQGPAIKAVWEPMAPESGDGPRGRGSQDTRGHSRRGARTGRRRSLIFGSAAAVVIVGAGIANLNSRSAPPQKGAATTVLPMVSDSASASVQSQAGDLTQATVNPSASASHSRSPSPSPSHSASASARPSASSTAGRSGSATPSPTQASASASHSPSCWLIFCG